MRTEKHRKNEYEIDNWLDMIKKQLNTNEALEVQTTHNQKSKSMIISLKQNWYKFTENQMHFIFCVNLYL